MLPDVALSSLGSSLLDVLTSLLILMTAGTFILLVTIAQFCFFPSRRFYLP